MSTQIMAQCWPIKISPTQKSVLISLADNADDNGECWPSQTTIADRTCLSERAVRDAIKGLESLGYVVADRTNGRHTRYFICPTPAAGSAVYKQHKDEKKPLTPAGAAAPAPDATPANGAGTPAGAAGEPRQELPVPRQMAPVPRQELPTNRKEPKDIKQKQRALGASDLAELGVSEELAEAWLSVRKAKRAAPLSEYAFALFRNQAEKAGWTIPEAIEKCVRRNWISFEAEWVAGEKKPAPSAENRWAGTPWENAIGM